MRMGQGVRTGLEHGGITCVLQTQFSSLYLSTFNVSASQFIYALCSGYFNSHVDLLKED